MKDKFKSSRERVKELEREKAVLEAEKATLEEEKRDVSLIHMREINRLKESRSFEVTHKQVRVQTEIFVTGRFVVRISIMPVSYTVKPLVRRNALKL